MNRNTQRVSLYPEKAIDKYLRGTLLLPSLPFIKKIITCEKVAIGKRPSKIKGR